jgi:hypothetical protein
MVTNVRRLTHVLLFVIVLVSVYLSVCTPILFADEDDIADSTIATSTLSDPLASLRGLYKVDQLPSTGTPIGDFVIGPGKVDITVAQGSAETVEMLVSNRTGEARRFNVTVQDAQGSQNPKDAIVLLGDDRGPYSIRDYVSVPHTSFILNPNERAHIPVTITIPPNAEPGGVYGSVLVDTVALDAVVGDTTGTVPQSAIIAKIGTLFFVTIPGDVAREGKLLDFTTIPKRFFYGSGPIPFGILFQNIGTMHLAPYGEIRVRNMFGEEVGHMELEPWFVFPEAQRLREVTWDRDVLFGRYTASVSVNRSYDDIIDEMQFSFWVLPWKPLLLLFFSIFTVLFLIRLLFKNFEFKRRS